MQDTRALPSTPSSYDGSAQLHFKASAAIGLSTSYYCTVLGLRGWTDDTGGKAHEFAFGDDNNVYLRSGFDSTGWGGWRSLLVSNVDGDFGIGTTNPTEKLSVNGKIRAREIKVEASNWPDYVFEEGYKVGTLEGLESYIKANKHLPEVPDAKEVEANGVALGEMNKLLLKKIEELTLYVIELKKENVAQQKQLDQLQKTTK